MLRTAYNEVYAKIAVKLTLVDKYNDSMCRCSDEWIVDYVFLISNHIRWKCPLYSPYNTQSNLWCSIFAVATKEWAVYHENVCGSYCDTFTISYAYSCTDVNVDVYFGWCFVVLPSFFSKSSSNYYKKWNCNSIKWTKIQFLTAKAWKFNLFVILT